MMEKLLNDKEDLLNERLRVVEYNINEVTDKIGKNKDDIHLVAATKTVSVENINRAINLGVKIIGENKVQELLKKYDDVEKDHCQVHFIGHLQTNKVKDIIGKVQMIQSLDSYKLGKEISRVSKMKGVVTNVMIEVNIGREENKFGVFEENLTELLKKLSELENLKIRGLMTIPPFNENTYKTRDYFRKMTELFIDIADKKIDNINMDFLSMGMSADYIQAIENGANMIRIGSGLFGSRN